MKEKIKSFEDACQHLGIEPKLPEVDGLFPDHRKAVVAFYKLSTIISALNNGWKPDWNDYRQRKWWNFFYVESNSAGFVYSLSSHSPSTTNATFGSRLCFKSEELAEFAAKNFIDLYNDLLLFEKHL
jgi:hypothetical protein